jgi:hypothetical protein
VDRGAGRPAVSRLPYFPADARKELAKYGAVVVVGCRVPVAMFGYSDGLSQVVDFVEQNVVEVRRHVRSVPSASVHIHTLSPPYWWHDARGSTASVEESPPC